MFPRIYTHAKGIDTQLHPFGLPIAALVFCFLVIGLNPGLFHPVLHPDPPLLEMGIEVGCITEELRALKTEINLLVLKALFWRPRKGAV